MQAPACVRRTVLASLFLVLAWPALASEIREFELATRERLGQQLFYQDNRAARAEDLAAETFPDKKSRPLRGWITELGKNGDTVYLIMEQDSEFVLAYSVHFPLVDPPYAKDRRGEALPESVATRWKARRTAMAAVKRKLLDGVLYNFEVLEDPEGPGFLVYGLASTQSNKEIVVAGHFRVSVSADGAKALRVDSLNRGYMKQNRTGPKGEETVAVAVSQLTSKIPVETFIYSSELYRVPFYVGTTDGAVWRVVNGEIVKVHRPGRKPAAARGASDAKKK